MAGYIWIFFVLPLVISVQVTLGQYSRLVGRPLFLSKYIESGNISEGRRLARVRFTESFHIKSYAGFFTVNETYNSNQFFWYFPPVSNNADAPVLLWLQGGPGASSLYGLFNENGPLMVKNGRFERRKYHWALDHHLIYIDNPVGSGFSFTNDCRGYSTNETRVGEELYSSMTQFFRLFPELQKNEFFVTGESYAGKYVPALAYTIHKKNPTEDLKINLKGLAIGNGFCDPEHLMLYSEYLYQIGLIDWNQAKLYKEYEDKIVDEIKNEQWQAAYDSFNNLLNGENGVQTLFQNTTEFNFYYNYLYSEDYIGMEYTDQIQKNYVRRDIHVGSLPFNNGSLASKYLQEDFMQSSAPWISELLDHYNITFYNGQLDIIVAYPLTVNFLRNLNFTASEEYETAERCVWRVDGEIAGYAKKAGNLIEVMMRNAGHLAPTDQPKWALDLITRVSSSSFEFD